MEPTTDTTQAATERPVGRATPVPPPRAPQPPESPPTAPVPPAAALPARPAEGGGRFTLRRSRTDRMLGGVCGGLATSLDVDPALVRIGVVVLTVLSSGFGAIVYVAAWIVVPEGDAG